MYKLETNLSILEFEEFIKDYNCVSMMQHPNWQKIKTNWGGIY